MEELKYHLDDFDGPLDLLLTLIQKQKLNIHDIPIVLICSQYMEYIQEAQRLDLEIASEFLIMASQLMLIKSRILLPGRENRDDPRSELVNQLELYIATKQQAEQLKPLYALYSGRMEKETDEIPPEKGIPLGLDLDLMTQALNAMLQRVNALQAEPETLIAPLITIPIVSVEEKIRQIVKYLEENEAASLFTLLKEADNKAELIARFMGILELIKIGQVYICESIFDATPKEIPDEDPKPKRGKINNDYNATEGLLITFRLNPNYDPSTQEFVSEFESESTDSSNNSTEMEKNNGK